MLGSERHYCGWGSTFAAHYGALLVSNQCHGFQQAPSLADALRPAVLSTTSDNNLANVRRIWNAQVISWSSGEYQIYIWNSYVCVQGSHVCHTLLLALTGLNPVSWKAATGSHET